MTDPLEILAYVAEELVDDENTFEAAKEIGLKILDLFEKEAAGYPKGTVFLAIFITVCALVDTGEHIKNLN